MLSALWQHAALAAVVCCGSAGIAHAHAPLPRKVAVAPDASGAVAVRMPGFGWLLRDKPDGAFAYACDALLGVSPLEEHAPMAYRSDGTLLVGTARGVRFVGGDRCPSAAVALDGQSIAALAVHASQSGRAYAITTNADQPAMLQRSDDGGETWQQGAELAALPVGALALDPSDPQTLYVSQPIDTEHSQIAVSQDGGETFETFVQDRALTLLYAQASPPRLWAMARIPNQGVGVSVLRAAGPEGPWSEVLTINFFGGFAVDPNDADVIWVGDEARGVFRSSDGGDSFKETQPDVSSADLAYGAGALWSCTPGLPERPALARSPDALAVFEPIMAFRDVTQLVDCAPDTDVAQICLPAWIEWQRDVLGVTPSLPDAGVTEPDAGNTEPDASAMGEPDAAIEATDAGPPPDDDTGCSVRTPRRNASPAWLLLASVFIALRGLRRRPRGCGPHVYPRTAAHPRAQRAPTATRPRSQPRGRS
jgi:photosystem II stability/assembly factor-like uncharacterized protein